MTIFAIGTNHTTASVSDREKIYFSPDRLALYLQDLLNQPGVTEAVLLSTCNRSELYACADDQAPLMDWLATHTTLASSTLQSILYCYEEEAAVRHMMQVACGLDSMILGEPQILGQMKEAFSESCAVGATGTLFRRLFQEIFKMAKEIRTNTAIGACPVSVATAAIHFAKQRCANFKQAQVALIGAGEAGELLLRYLNAELSHPVKLINRHIEKALTLADQPTQVFSLDQLEQALNQVQVVFSATGSELPVVNQQVMAEVMAARAYQPLILIDIAVPRDIEPSVAEIPGVQLFCIDDLKAVIEVHRLGRAHAADKAREMIQVKCVAFMQQLASLDQVTHTIRAYRGQVKLLAESELNKAKQQLQQGVDPSQVLDAFVYAFTNKILHVPSVRLRQAGVEGHYELLHYAKQLFAISDHEVECL